MRVIHLIILFFITQSAIGQTMESTIDKLLQFNIINKDQQEDVLEILKKRQDNSNQAVLLALQWSETVKIVGKKDIRFGTNVSFGNTKPEAEEQKKMNVELHNYLSSLEEAHFITEPLYLIFRERIDSNIYMHKLQLLREIFLMQANIDRLSPQNILPFADKLLDSKVISKDNYEKLGLAIKNGSIKNDFQFVGYCKKAVIIKESNYPSEPEKYLELIHRDVSKLLPELSFSDFKFQIKLDSTISDDDSKFYDFVVSLKCNGKIYRQKSSYRFYSSGKNQYFGNKIDQQEFYKIFNKVLSDNQSIFRLHEVKSSPNNAVDWTQFGIIALTKDQADMLHGAGVYFRPSYENFKTTLTSKKIEDAISQFSKIGLLSHLSAGQIKIATEKVAEQENKNLNDVLQCFPQTIYFFDIELGNLEDPYKEILDELSLVSHGLFKPSNITDNFSKPTNSNASIKFSLNNKEYTKDIKVEEDWVDPSFFDLIKQVVIENKLNGQFYELYTGGQEASIIFLTTEQYDYLRANKLLVFADQGQIEEEE
jgi:hypothetical protein